MTARVGADDRLLAGRSLQAGPETYAEHQARFGPLPTGGARADLIDALDASGLLGRGGGAFPVGRKWRTIASGQAAGPCSWPTVPKGSP